MSCDIFGTSIELCRDLNEQNIFSKKVETTDRYWLMGFSLLDSDKEDSYQALNVRETEKLNLEDLNVVT